MNNKSTDNYLNDTCQYIFKRGQYKDQKCKQRTFGNIYCENHKQIVDYKIILNLFK